MPGSELITGLTGIPEALCSRVTQSSVGKQEYGSKSRTSLDICLSGYRTA